MHVGDQVAVLITCIYKHAFGMDYANNENNMRRDHNVYGSNGPTHRHRNRSILAP